MTNLKNELLLNLENQNKYFTSEEITKDAEILDHLKVSLVGNVVTIITKGNPATGEYTVKIFKKLNKDLFKFLSEELRG